MPSKSSSRAHVPDLISTIKKPDSQRTTTLGHRRSQSETINTKTVKVDHQGRLSNVRPRYLEPKSNNKLASNLAVKAISHSSSDSSRNASPSNRHHPPMKKQQNKENDSTNMSRDSLASPAKVNKLMKNKSSHDIDRSIDSLGESLLSSMKTEKTLSQESIVIMKRKDNLNKPALKSISRSNPMINKQSTTTTATTTTKMRPLSNKLVNKTRPLSGQTTNENSPSSVTTKSSRLSSLSSPRDVHKTLQQVPVKKSFLSAKSKEILAKKQSLNYTESTKSIPATVRNERISVNKSKSTSHVPHSNVKPNPFNTTLHLRRTAKLEDEKVVKKSGSAKSIPAMHRNGDGKMLNGRSGKNEKKIEKICVEIESDVEDIKPIRIDSKLERSSTFCKESSDVPLGELQIIE